MMIDFIVQFVVEIWDVMERVKMTEHLEKFGARMDLIKIDAHHCWVCGIAFDGEEHKKTNHDAIPRFLKPKRNVMVPICQKCHRELNTKYTIQSIPKIKIKKIRNFIKNLDEFINKNKKILENYEGLE